MRAFRIQLQNGVSTTYEETTNPNGYPTKFKPETTHLRIMYHFCKQHKMKLFSLTHVNYGHICSIHYISFGGHVEKSSPNIRLTQKPHTNTDPIGSNINTNQSLTSGSRKEPHRGATKLQRKGPATRSPSFFTGLIISGKYILFPARM